MNTEIDKIKAVIVKKIATIDLSSTAINIKTKKTKRKTE